MNETPRFDPAAKTIPVPPPTGFIGHDPFDAAVPPIYQTSLFLFDSYAELEDVFAGRSHKPIYSRGDNPTVQILEGRIAEMEGAEAARAFSSGMGAIAATILAFVNPGDRIVTVRHVYSDAFRFFEKVLKRFGVLVDYIDGTDTERLIASLPGAKLAYFESPTSMVFELQDLVAVGAAARQHGVLTIVDNSWATPLYQKPIAAGIDLVIHAASKYLGGQSDTVAGLVTGSKQHIARINGEIFPYTGAKLSPFEAWLVLRNLETLPFRMRHHHEAGLEVAHWLKASQAVGRVMHPVFSDHPGRNTLTGFGGLFSFEVTDDIDVAAFVDALQLVRIGVSWGGPESLVVPAKAALSISPETNVFARFGVSDRTIRLNVGLHEAKAIIADLEQALAQAAR
ncbi:aminotransferase class I/II-fold pyridoxal phosphate-dependent enzyme [Agrobacterium vitis]|uniref:Aminotransferase class I/II-fold pyridoxal phosphate-dependent enzyme n=1 Tax=Agrobacterium vitis TaxID=373 RepID=A0AAE4WEI3_AGRVI|nr:PLP-dependent transferase [Agrobacterium vitis]MCF1500251.1 aminotransferase class I/II-fold pyridoxal phosphate-dependent enzyme [Allorhizobium sp. Av2]MCM2441686.1 aminotransferase class I/II-fold pyridoxal phosphate-dependent enzyme [Agrobacterium vitis]MUZ58934.1 aminotransferase class I/II-fold pyridoxal phosphate-dependent enzyme [Agrobacterium vitis]MVA68040.1 aminotransferase class I/II-fold pyridoxal phosphate-dependent enzyme [Agrobacterium vitis]MVA88698.1 aminotransferase class 